MILDVDARVLIDGENVNKLSAREVTFLEALSDGGVVSFDRFIGILWPEHEPDYAFNIIKVIACRLRRCLPIRSVWGKGYRLDGPLTVHSVGVRPIFIPAERRKDLQRILISHFDRAAADRVLASMVGG